MHAPDGSFAPRATRATPPPAKTFGDIEQGKREAGNSGGRRQQAAICGAGSGRQDTLVAGDTVKEVLKRGPLETLPMTDDCAPAPPTASSALNVTSFSNQARVVASTIWEAVQTSSPMPPIRKSRRRTARRTSPGHHKLV